MGAFTKPKSTFGDELFPTCSCSRNACSVLNLAALYTRNMYP